MKSPSFASININTCRSLRAGAADYNYQLSNNYLPLEIGNEWRYKRYYRLMILSTYISKLQTKQHLMERVF